jgi:hypothetical protein
MESMTIDLYSSSPTKQRQDPVVYSSYAEQILVKLNGNAVIQSKENVLKTDSKDFELFLERLSKGLKIKFKPQQCRLFNSNGMELFQTDLSLLKDKEIVYFSLGEDFDINSFYSEYKMDKQLGAGGFGRVMLAVSRVNGQKVAIKATHNDSVDNVRDLDGLFTEAQTLKALKHPNIVTMLNCFVDRKTRQAIMIMEYLEGGELSALLQEKGRLREEEMVEIFNQLVSAITYCHRYKVIHRDLKPENIIRATQEGNCFKVE